MVDMSSKSKVYCAFLIYEEHFHEATKIWESLSSSCPVYCLVFLKIKFPKYDRLIRCALGLRNTNFVFRMRIFVRSMNPNFI